MEQPAIKEIRKPEFKFIYVHHTPEKFESIIPELEKSNVILLEVVTDKETKNMIEVIVNKALDVDSPQKKERLIELLSDPSGDKNFTFLIAEYAIKHNKALILIDESSGDPGDTLYAKSEEENELALGAFFDKGKPMTAYEHYKKHLYLSAQSVKTRNDHVVNDINQIIQDNDLGNVKICVIQGEYHRETYRSFRKSPNAQKTNSSRSFDSNLKIFDLSNEIEDRITTNNLLGIEDLIKRDFLGHFFIPTNRHDTNGIPIEKISEVVRNISEEDLKRYFGILANLQNPKISGGQDFDKSYMFKQVGIIGQEIIDKHYRKD